MLLILTGILLEFNHLKRVNGASLFIQGFQTAPVKVDGDYVMELRILFLQMKRTGSVASPNLISIAKFVKFASTYSASYLL